MFVYSFRLSTVKFFAVAALSVAALFCLVAFVPTAPDNSKAASAIVYTGVESGEDCADFVRQFGWEIGEEPVEEKSITVPETFDETFEAYNDLQKKQGLSLNRYKGKEVTRYTYRITNYPDYDGTVYVNLLVYKNKVIGGDVSGAEADGFIHGFIKTE